MNNKDKISLFHLPTLINPNTLILSNITSDKDYIRNKYDSCLRSMGGRISNWYDEEIKYPIYGSPKLKGINANKVRRDELIEKIQTETFPVIDRRYLTIEATGERNKDSLSHRIMNEISLPNTMDKQEKKKINIGTDKASLLIHKEMYKQKLKQKASRNKGVRNIHSYNIVNPSNGVNTIIPQAQLINLKFSVEKTNKIPRN